MKHKLFPALAFLSVLFIELDLKYLWIYWIFLQNI